MGLSYLAGLCLAFLAWAGVDKGMVETAPKKVFDKTQLG